MDLIDELIKKNRLKKVFFSDDMINKEFRVSLKDLDSARKSLADENYKWSIIQSYYAVFHAARALVFKAGYREESHSALKSVFRLLYIDTEKLSIETYYALERGMSLREMADYKETYSQNSAENILQAVTLAINEIRKFLNENE